MGHFIWDPRDHRKGSTSPDPHCAISIRATVGITANEELSRRVPVGAAPHKDRVLASRSGPSCRSSGRVVTLHVEQQSRLYPNRPLFPTKIGGSRGPGAWEVFGRVSDLHPGKKIFTDGFADSDLWSN
jgi:hypothetical protein